ncbi:carbohydrate sulfotransferase 12 isoform X2 [Perca flavescens]|uniref:carbohydrate sulfotransferase 12 isoform X2 n=1 Tax=Perca flavescens TaxID=8167 RepID=UPI00106EF43F|nr:carbohydrate sulfotransferase 12-like isoform X2 [Perca flavescens]
MAPCTREFVLLLGFLGFAIVVMMFFFQWDALPEVRGKQVSSQPQITTERIPEQQELRKKLLRETCDGDRDAFTEGKHSSDDLSVEELDNLIVDDKHCIIYCFIPKSKPYPDPKSINVDLVHDIDKLIYLNAFPKEEIEAKLKNYTKFMFVRDPFTRLISAYRDKFLQWHDEYYYRNFSREILRLYTNLTNPPQTVKEASVTELHPSFYNFIQYLLDPRTEEKQPFDLHWKQMYRQCHPCLIQYDFLGHQETLQQDAKQLLKMLKLENDIKFPPSYENMTSPTSVSEWFGTVPLEDRRKLYQLYEKDFRLFGYRRPGELLDG